MGRRRPDEDDKAVADTLVRFLTGQRPRALDRALDTPGAGYTRMNTDNVLGARRAGDMMISAETVRTLDLLGIDAGAIAIAVFAYGLPPCRITVGDMELLAVARVEDDRTKPLRLAIEIGLAPGCRWIPHISFLDMDKRVPDSILMAMAGRSLTELVSHPLLDQLGLIVESAFDDHGTATVHMPLCGDQRTISSLRSRNRSAL